MWTKEIVTGSIGNKGIWKWGAWKREIWTRGIGTKEIETGGIWEGRRRRHFGGKGAPEIKGRILGFGRYRLRF